MMDVLRAGTGEFGAEVLGLLETYPYAGRTVAATAVTEALAERPDALVLALFCVSRQLCATVDSVAADNETGWLPIVLENAYLRVGPWIDHRTGPCFRCYYARRSQHDAQHDTTDTLHRAYDDDPGVAPRGHLPHHARIAAGLAARLLKQALEPTGRQPDGRGPAGEVYALRLHTGQISRHHVLACHGCPRCARPQPIADPLATTLRSVLAGAP